jgi:hypothetical protein
MMTRIIKNIPAFSILFAGLAISAHMIIPHDHHLAEPFSSQEDSCPVSNDKAGHHTGFPVHCHAFNDLSSEKATTSFIPANIRHNDIAFGSFPDPFALDLHSPCITFIDIRKPFPDSHFLEFSPLRAPPSIS